MPVPCSTPSQAALGVDAGAWRRLALVAALGCLGLVGCGSGPGRPDREGISGTVHFQGQPIRKGEIRFVPVNDAGSTLSGAVIIDGSFTVPKSLGLVPGKYRVEVYADNTSGLKADADAPGESRPDQANPEDRRLTRDPIPAKYNRDSKLEVEVKAGAENVLKLDLK